MQECSKKVMVSSAQKHQKGKGYNINVTKTLEKKVQRHHKDPSRSKISIQWKVRFQVNTILNLPRSKILGL